MSLEDPNGGGLNREPDEGVFFSDPGQAHNRDGPESRGRALTSASNANVQPDGNRQNATTNSGADMTTPMPMPIPTKRGMSGLLPHFSNTAGAGHSTMSISTSSTSTSTPPSREGLDTTTSAKELRDFWKAYMHTPLSDSGGGEFVGGKATPLAAGGGGYRKRVSSLPSSKTPIVERELGDMGAMYSGGEQSLVYPALGAIRAGVDAGAGAAAGAAQHPEPTVPREDLRSYEAAVMARKAPTTLNLNPRMVKGRGGDHANVHSISSFFIVLILIPILF